MNISIRTALTAAVLFASTCVNAEVVVIVNPKHPAASMTAEQVANVYLGKDASFSPADLPESAGQRNEFYTKVAGKDSAQVKAIWARTLRASSRTRSLTSSSAARTRCTR